WAQRWPWIEATSRCAVARCAAASVVCEGPTRASLVSSCSVLIFLTRGHQGLPVLLKLGQGGGQQRCRRLQVQAGPKTRHHAGQQEKACHQTQGQQAVIVPKQNRDECRDKKNAHAAQQQGHCAPG